MDEGGTHTILQQLEDSIVSLWGEIGVLVPVARYITLHGGVGKLGADETSLQHELLGMAKGVTTASKQAADAWGKARLAQEAVAILTEDVSRAISLLREELAEVKSEREALETTVLTLAAAVTSLMKQAALGLSGGVTQPYLGRTIQGPQ